jgi:hypothetical protein
MNTPRHHRVRIAGCSWQDSQLAHCVGCLVGRKEPLLLGVELGRRGWACCCLCCRGIISSCWGRGCSSCVCCGCAGLATAAAVAYPALSTWLIAQEVVLFYAVGTAGSSGRARPCYCCASTDEHLHSAWVRLDQSRLRRQLATINLCTVEVQEKSQCTRLAADSIVPSQGRRSSLEGRQGVAPNALGCKHRRLQLFIGSETHLASPHSGQRNLTASLAVPALAEASPVANAMGFARLIAASTCSLRDSDALRLIHVLTSCCQSLKSSPEQAGTVDVQATTVQNVVHDSADQLPVITS